MPFHYYRNAIPNTVTLSKIVHFCCIMLVNCGLCSELICQEISRYVSLRMSTSHQLVGIPTHIFLNHVIVCVMVIKD